MTPKKIILHCSATKDSGTVSWGAIRKYHTQVMGWKDIGYHYGIELVGDHYEVLIGRMVNEIGAHCEGHNSDSIGICFVGDFDSVAVPVPQWQKGLQLVDWLCSVFNIHKNQVFGHREFNPGKSCPGKLFDINRFRNELKYG